MQSHNASRVLTINTGSSSLKAALYDMGDRESPILSTTVERIGLPASRMRVTDSRATTMLDHQGELPDQHAALSALFAWLAQQNLVAQIDVVGHRIVYGGRHYSGPAVVNPAMVNSLRDMIPLDPEHLPQAIGAIDFFSNRDPTLLQVACFDTAFHQHLPKVAQSYALPRHFYEDGIRRFGFHGLSYEYVVQALHELDGDLAGGRVIVAHLGNGASMAAINGGKCMDTSMGFTPNSGLVMGTRAGDIDSGVLLHLITNKRMTAQGLDTLINQQSGLLGVSGTSADMQELLAVQSNDPRAAEAIELFCYRAKKYLGAYVAALSGLDILIFTGGIGEHAAVVRERICAGLQCFGIQIDPGNNHNNAPIISSVGSRVKVRVIKTDEGLMIARHAAQLIRGNLSLH